jgi:predicted nucleic acid-binding protein
MKHFRTQIKKFAKKFKVDQRQFVQSAIMYAEEIHRAISNYKLVNSWTLAVSIAGKVDWAQIIFFIYLCS